MSDAAQPRKRTCTRCKADPKYRVRGWGGPGARAGNRNPLASNLDELVCEQHLAAAQRDAHRRANVETTLADPLGLSGAVAVGYDATQAALF